MGQRSYEHVKAQKSGKKRDYYACQACGSKNQVEGHHIFDHYYAGAPHADNIITLCHECHKEVHKGNMDIMVF